MARTLATWAAAIVFAGACLPAATARADTQFSTQSWSDLHTRYDGIVDRVEAVQQPPGAIGGGPPTFTSEQDVLRVYRTPSPSDGFWTDFRARCDNAIEAAARNSPRAAP